MLVPPYKWVFTFITQLEEAGQGKKLWDADEPGRVYDDLVNKTGLPVNALGKPG